ncbi:TonB-dependent siderophore receptor [Erythrobacter sp.]|uniref:TonB-dependent receptor plug domain-containing protein n=1 Tax=Erythrobacter sp. TaxID=1042 RepID=UPI0025B7A9D2|nr:TonB-dependent receptor [Erythrobacter sp.]
MKTSARLFAGTMLAGAVAVFPAVAFAQDSDPESESGASEPGNAIVVTGSRIQRTELTATSPVSSFDEEQIELDRAVTIEDISVRIPQFAGGVNATQTGSDGRGAQTLDLRNLGQNRTLVLLNGTRMVPFSFRNAVDVNSIPAPLLKQVDVLTGGAAAVYGADAVAGVVNFIVDTAFEGVRVGGSWEGADDLQTYNTNLTLGASLGDRGGIVFYADYTDRGELLVGDRDFLADNTTSTLAGAGGNFTDVASGNFFAFDESGTLRTTRQTSDFSDLYPAVQPLERINVSTFFDYEIAPFAEIYGRAMYTKVDTVGAGRAGNNPVTVNETVFIDETNPFLTDDIRSRLTFVNGQAEVAVERTLGELGILTAATERTTTQYQVGLRGPLADWLRYDAYVQHGRVEEETVTSGDALRVDGSGNSRFAAIVNSVDIFGPGADLSGFGSNFVQEIRDRKQTVAAFSISGDSSPLFSLPAGPIRFAIGYEYRDESLETGDEAALVNGLTYRGSTGGVIVGGFDANEVYAEVLVPVLADKPFFQELTLEGAIRFSDFSNADVGNTDKLGFSWQVDDNIRFRGTRQTVVRAPNIGEFAAPVFSIPFSLLRTVPRLQPRYLGDPCVIGTGDQAQCDRFGAPPQGSYDSLDPANLTGQYFFGGNPDIGPENGTTYTLGAIITPQFARGLEIIVDYYDIRITDAVGQIQPVDALQSCYVDNPVADNPICQAISRDPTTGFIDDAFVNDRNLGIIEQSGVDIDVNYSIDLSSTGFVTGLRLGYQGTIVTDYTIQRNPVLDPVDCKGTFGFACSSDAVSLVQPDYRHRVAATFDADMGMLQFVWRRIGEVENASDRTEKIGAVDYFDINAQFDTGIYDMKINVGVRNLFDKEPPQPASPGAFGTYPGTYDIVGRTFGASASITF